MKLSNNKFCILFVILIIKIIFHKIFPRYSLLLVFKFSQSTINLSQIGSTNFPQSEMLFDLQYDSINIILNSYKTINIFNIYPIINIGKATPGPFVTTILGLVFIKIKRLCINEYIVVGIDDMKLCPTFLALYIFIK